jgi:hypothetical protein
MNRHCYRYDHHVDLMTIDACPTNLPLLMANMKCALAINKWLA